MFDKAGSETLHLMERMYFFCLEDYIYIYIYNIYVYIYLYIYMYISSITKIKTFKV